MIEEQGQVKATDSKFAWIATDNETACHQCTAKAGCGSSLLRQLTAGNARYLKVANTLGVSTGDKVTVGISESALLTSSLVVYLIPLLSLVLFVVVAQLFLTFPEGLVILAGLIGLSAGLFIVKFLSSYLSCNPAYHPQLLRKI